MNEAIRSTSLFLCMKPLVNRMSYLKFKLDLYTFSIWNNVCLNRFLRDNLYFESAVYGIDKNCSVFGYNYKGSAIGNSIIYFYRFFQTVNFMVDFSYIYNKNLLQK